MNPYKEIRDQEERDDRPGRGIAMVVLGVPFAVLVTCGLIGLVWPASLLGLLLGGGILSWGAAWLLAVDRRLDYSWLIGMAACPVFVGLFYFTLFALLSTVDPARLS